MIITSKTQKQLKNICANKTFNLSNAQKKKLHLIYFIGILDGPRSDFGRNRRNSNTPAKILYRFRVRPESVRTKRSGPTRQGEHFSRMKACGDNVKRVVVRRTHAGQPEPTYRAHAVVQKKRESINRKRAVHAKKRKRVPHTSVRVVRRSSSKSASTSSGS